jgi:hypothetical protein
MEAFRMANSATAAKKKKKANDIHASLQADLGDITSAQKSLERSLSNLTVDLVKRFDDMIQLQNNLNFIQALPSASSASSGDLNLLHANAASGSGSVAHHTQRAHTPSPTAAMERTISRTRITEEIQRRTQLKKSLSGNVNSKS